MGEQGYIRKGPPHVVLRMIGPLVTLTSLGLLGTGVALPPSRWLYWRGVGTAAALMPTATPWTHRHPGASERHR